ncbi:BTAD domain-containing putative transcriptional regulator [Streptomyces sp. NPDC058758]|uniref:AfsR/SARP family transcriptional regulator n=1 Tax=Streptomyces sp. NPDC058758 TaxID=3346627 RepID=UPI0036BCDB4B
MRAEFQVLGPVSLLIGERQIDLGPARQRSFLTALLMEPRQPVTIDTLIDRVWGGSPPAGARNVVYTYIARLRRILAGQTYDGGQPVHIMRNPAGYFLDIAPEQVDLHRFRGLLSQARALPPNSPRRCQVLNEALQLWKGDPLTGVDDEWALRMRQGLRQLKNDALVEWAQAERQAGRGITVIAELRHALLHDPLAELLHEQLIRSLYASGQQAEALRHYERARLLIAEELGTDPAPRLQELHTQILTGTLPDDTAPPAGAAIAPPAPAPASASEPAPAPAPAQASRIPCMLPRDVPAPVGRRTETEAVRAALAPEASGRVVLVGSPGIGKTALAVHIAHRMAAVYPDGQLYLDLQGSTGEPLRTETALSLLLRQLGVAHDPDENPSALVHEYRSGLHGRRVLVVLDDAESERQIQPLLPAERHCGVLVATRRPSLRPVNADVVPVPRLDPAAGLALLENLIGPDRTRDEPDRARRLVDMCEGHPLILRALANRLLARPHTSLARLVRRIEAGEQNLETLSYGSLDICERLTSAYRQLPRPAARLLLALSDAPAVIRPDSTGAHSGVPGAPTDHEELLDVLVEAGFLDVHDAGGPGGPAYRLTGVRRVFVRRVRHLRETAEQRRGDLPEER